MFLYYPRIPYSNLSASLYNLELYAFQYTRIHTQAEQQLKHISAVAYFRFIFVAPHRLVSRNCNTKALQQRHLEKSVIERYWHRCFE